MKNFTFYQPRTKDEAHGLLGKDFGADSPRVLAGGQDLLGELKDRIVEPDALVAIKQLDELSGREVGAERLTLGALTTLRSIEEDSELTGGLGILREAAASIASPQIRSQATLGGNLCQRPRCWYYRNESTVCLKKGGDECFSYEGMNKYNSVLGGGPSFIVHPSDMAPALVALDAELTFEGPRDARMMPVEEFFTLPSQGDVLRENVLLGNELVTSIHVPTDRRTWRSTYVKFKERGSFDWALSAVALAVRMDGDVIAEARVCLGGVAPVPWRCRSTEELLAGRALDDEAAKLAGEDALRGAEPLGQNGYKIPLTKALIVKAVRQLASV